MNTADYRRLSDARELLQQLRFAPMSGSRRFWLLDECHQLSKAAQNCLLKALEEPPEHVYICLSTTDPQMLLSTIRDRCQCFQVSTVKRQEMVDFLAEVVESEEKPVTEEVLKAIAKKSDGTPRTALVMLDSVIDLDPDVMLESLENMYFDESEVIELSRNLLSGANEQEIFGILNGLKDQDPESIRRAVLGYCNSVLLNPQSKKQARQNAYLIITAFEKPTYDMGFPAISRSVYEAVHAV